MTAALLISFRETFEASLVVGIMLAFLHRTENTRHTKVIWAGVASGVLGSVLVAYLFQKLAGGFEGRAEELYEGVVMLLAAGLISSMVLWLALHGRHMKTAMERKIAFHLEQGALMSLFVLTALSILREGVEMVIFLQAAFIQSTTSTGHIGAIAGMVLAIASTYFLFRGMMKWFSLPHFFRITGVLLLLFGAGLVMHGVHEFQEAGLLPMFIEHLWSTEAVIPEESLFGSLLTGLFGYDAAPSLLQVCGYMVYTLVMLMTWKRVHRVQ